jgi:hypothetical protein
VNLCLDIVNLGLDVVNLGLHVVNLVGSSRCLRGDNLTVKGGPNLGPRQQPFIVAHGGHCGPRQFQV